MNYELFKSDKYLVGDIEWGGFGAMYARRKLIMQIAQAFNRTPVFRYTSYVYHDPFEQFKVNLDDIKKLGVKEVKKFDFTDSDEQVAFFDFGSYWNSPNMEKYQCWHPEKTDYLFYSGYMYNLLKLTDSYKEKVEEIISFLKEKYEINGFENVVALHLRRGDKITETPYLSETFLFDLLEKIGADKKIFVTSDELDYILEVESKYPNYEFIYDSDEKRYGNQMISNVDLVTRDPSLKEQETITFIKNVEILKQCKTVIGSYSSQMTKIAGSINSYLKNKNSVYLINPATNEFDTMGSSVQTS